MSGFWTLRVDSWPRGFEFVHLRVEFGPLGVEFMPLGFDCRHTQIDFVPMGIDFSLRESIFGLWKSISGPGSRFGALRVNFVHLGFGFWTCGSQL